MDNTDIPPEGFDDFVKPLNREGVLKNLIFDGYNPKSVVGIDIQEVEGI